MQFAIRSVEMRNSVKRSNPTGPHAFDVRASNDFNMVTNDMHLK